MMMMVAQKARGRWDSQEGEQVLRLYLDGSINAQEAAKRMETSEQGVYSAVSRLRRLRPVPVSTAIMKKLEELAELALPDVVNSLRGQILQAEAELKAARDENAQLRRRLAGQDEDRDEAGQRIIERARKMIGGSTPDDAS